MMAKLLLKHREWLRLRNRIDSKKPAGYCINYSIQRVLLFACLWPVGAKLTLCTDRPYESDDSTCFMPTSLEKNHKEAQCVLVMLLYVAKAQSDALSPV